MKVKETILIWQDTQDEQIAEALCRRVVREQLFSTRPKVSLEELNFGFVRNKLGNSPNLLSCNTMRLLNEFQKQALEADNPNVWTRYFGVMTPKHPLSHIIFLKFIEILQKDVSDTVKTKCLKKLRDFPSLYKDAGNNIDLSLTSQLLDKTFVCRKYPSLILRRLAFAVKVKNTDVSAIIEKLGNLHPSCYFKAVALLVDNADNLRGTDKLLSSVLAYGEKDTDYASAAADVAVKLMMLRREKEPEKLVVQVKNLKNIVLEVALYQKMLGLYPECSEGIFREAYSEMSSGMPVLLAFAESNIVNPYSLRRLIFGSVQVVGPDAPELLPLLQLVSQTLASLDKQIFLSQKDYDALLACGVGNNPEIRRLAKVILSLLSEQQAQNSEDVVNWLILLFKRDASWLRGNLSKRIIWEETHLTAADVSKILKAGRMTEIDADYFLEVVNRLFNKCRFEWEDAAKILKELDANPAFKWIEINLTPEGKEKESVINLLL